MKLNPAVRRQVEAATVQLPDKGGQGVLVRAGFILTAMHCIDWNLTEGLVLGDHHPLQVKTRSGDAFKVQPAYADVVSDMAALHEMDNQEFPADADAFGAWRDLTTPLDVSAWMPGPGESRPAHVLSHLGDWIAAAVTNPSHAKHTFATYVLETDSDIRGGTSGGPVVDQDGRLLGVVSNGTRAGLIPLVRTTMPAWILGRLKPPRARKSTRS